jgi:malate synthase
LPGRSLLFVRNVGHLMTNPAILLADGSEIPEGIMDAVITGHRRACTTSRAWAVAQQRKGSIYIVKPKMHGPEEAAFTNDLFDAVEDLLGLERHTVKVGVMDEERRTIGQSGRLHPGGEGPHRVHQHRLPRPHRRRDPHLDARRRR